jgi:hypothetical protein
MGDDRGGGRERDGGGYGGGRHGGGSGGGGDNGRSGGNDSALSVYVGGFPYDYTDGQLRDLFKDVPGLVGAKARRARCALRFALLRALS